MLVSIDGERLRLYLKREGIEHRELAWRIGIHPDTITDWKREFYPMLSDISYALDVHPLELLMVDERGVLMIDRPHLKAVLKQRHMTFRTLYEFFGITRLMLYRFTYQKFRTVSVLAAALGVSPVALLKFDQENNDNGD